MKSEYFCQNIKNLRMKKGLSQKEMAERMKISVNSLSKIENKKLPPRLMVDVLFELESCFNIEAYRFLMKDLGK